MSAALKPNERTLVGIGDDAAVLATPDGRVVATTDFLLEGRHFRRDWSSAADVGHKAAARSLADCAAMGARPTALLVALAAPPGLPVSWARELAEGLARECARVGASVIGGDTARADSVLLAVTGLGDLGGREPVRRSGARPGDLVAVAGPLGHAAAGLALLEAGLDHDPLEHDPLDHEPLDHEPLDHEPLDHEPLDHDALVREHLRPSPPYEAGPEAAALGATAMIDVSDGLLADLGHVSAASGVQIRLASAGLRPGERLLGAARDLWSRTGPVSRPAHVPTPADVARAWVLTGGEDHALVATFPAGTRLPPRWRVIGEAGPGRGVVVDGQPGTGSPGWDHFTSGR